MKTWLPAAALALLPSAYAVQINEIRIDEPGTDVNEYFELKGTPGESLDGLTYLVVGDHSNYGNEAPDPVFKGFGTIEFAFDLTGFVIPDDGYFLVSETDIKLVNLDEVDFDVADLIFENLENVSHLLVRNYTGSPVEKDSDQYGDKAIDIDTDNDGIADENLPWDEIVDGIAIVGYPDSLDGLNDPNYAESLGIAAIGPDINPTPQHVFRNPFNGSWTSGRASLVGGLNLDTPGSSNSEKPFFYFQPTIVESSALITINGANLVNILSIQVNDVPVTDFNDISDSVLEIQLSEEHTTGPIFIETNAGAYLSDSDLRVLPEGTIIRFVEEFENSLGGFTAISLSSSRNWRQSVYNQQGYAQMGGYDRDGEEPGSEDWLISPAIDLSAATNPVLDIVTARAYGADGPALEVLISTNYDMAAPNREAWTPLTITVADGDPFFEQAAGTADLSAFIGESIHIAFRYTSPDSSSANAPTWQVHEVLVTDDAPEFSPGYALDANLGWGFYYTPGWVFNLNLGLVNIDAAPWIYSPEFGYLYWITGSIANGAWFYIDAPRIGTDFEIIYLIESNGGWFQYGNGAFDNFITPQIID